MGRQNIDECINPEEKSEVVRTQVRRDKILFEEMTYMYFKWGLLLGVFKVALVLMDRQWVNDPNEEEFRVFYCDTAQQLLIYTNEKGTLYWLAFSIQ